MTVGSTRTLKEARALLYPWCAVVIMVAMPFLLSWFESGSASFRQNPDPFPNMLFQIGVLMGIPFLACLSFGNEFRHKTMDLLVSQPVDRLKIWREKGLITVLAVVTVIMVASLSGSSFRIIASGSGSDFARFLVITTCSAGFWTLVGRSILGGFVLNIAGIILFFSAKTSLWFWNSTSGYISEGFANSILWAAALGYSVFMLWLGRWMLLHRESGGGLSGLDVTVAIPAVLPERIAQVFRCRPDQLIFNLIRRELRLLRPLWLLMALYIVGWSAMAVSFSFVPNVGEWQRTVRIILAVVTATYPVIALFLAASLSLGEERAFGVQLWHLALPLSIRTQWLVRLLSGLIAGTLSAIAVPAALQALAQGLLRPEFMKAWDATSFIEPVHALLAFFLVGFWCAIVARDLIRTAGLIPAMGGMIFVAIGCSIWITEGLIKLFEYPYVFIVSWFQLDPFTLYGFLDWLPQVRRTPNWLLVVLLCLVMTAHTYRLFRRLPEENTLKLVRPVLPYLALIMIFVSLGTIRMWNGGVGAGYEMFLETERAIVKLQPVGEFTVEDLSRASVLPSSIRRWLRNSTMNVTISDPPAGNSHLVSRRWKTYELTIHFGNGSTCKAEFASSQDGSGNVWPRIGKCIQPTIRE